MDFNNPTTHPDCEACCKSLIVNISSDYRHEVFKCTCGYKIQNLKKTAKKPCGLPDKVYYTAVVKHRYKKVIKTVADRISKFHVTGPEDSISIIERLPVDYAERVWFRVHDSAEYRLIFYSQLSQEVEENCPTSNWIPAFNSDELTILIGPQKFMFHKNFDWYIQFEASGQYLCAIQHKNPDWRAEGHVWYAKSELQAKAQIMNTLLKDRLLSKNIINATIDRYEQYAERMYNGS